MAGSPAFGFGTPFFEQIEFLRNKLALPSDRWDDIQKSAHDRGFIVAGAKKAELVQDLHDLIIQRAQEGKGLEAYRKDFKALVQKHGWTGWTGQGTKAGEAWRTAITYDTNMSTSYAAGRWEQLTHPELLSINPYWRYVHADGVRHPRPWHLSWNGITLPADDEFWQTHFAPNGWKCHCRIESASKSDFEAAKADGKANRPAGWNVIDPKTGAPMGIDKGFDYAPGARAKVPLKDFIDEKLIRLNSRVGAAMYETLKPILLSERNAALETLVSSTFAVMQAKGDAVVAWAMTPDIVDAAAAQGIELENSAVWLRDQELLHALRDSKNNRGSALPVEVWQKLSAHLDEASVYLDAEDQALLFAFDVAGKTGKVVVRVNYTGKLRVNGQRQAVTSNFISTGGVVDSGNLKNPRLKALK